MAGEGEVTTMGTKWNRDRRRIEEVVVRRGVRLRAYRGEFVEIQDFG